MTPTTNNNCGLWISSVSMKRLHASIVILKHRATKNTAFTRAPRTSARAHLKQGKTVKSGITQNFQIPPYPKVFLDHFFGDIFTDKNDITSAAISPSM